MESQILKLQSVLQIEVIKNVTLRTVSPTGQGSPTSSISGVKGSKEEEKCWNLFVLLMRPQILEVVKKSK